MSIPAISLASTTIMIATTIPFILLYPFRPSTKLFHLLSPSPHKHHQATMRLRTNFLNLDSTILINFDDLHHHASSLEHLRAKDSRAIISTPKPLKYHQSPQKPYQILFNLTPTSNVVSYSHHHGIEASKGAILSSIIFINQAK